MAPNLAPLFQTVGDFGGSVARARLAADQYKLQQLLDQLGIKQGQTNLEESQERLKRLKAEPSTETEAMQQKFQAFEQILKRPLTDSEKKLLMGIPWQAERNPIQEKISQTEEALGRKLTEDEKNIIGGLQPKPAAQKPQYTKTYDPSGNLRYAWTDPNTGEVSAWGQLVPESDLHDRYQDEAGNFHDVTLERFRKVDPGAIRMSDKAEKQWQSIAQVTSIPHPSKLTNSGQTKTVGTGTGDRIIGHGAPKYSAVLKPLMTEAAAKYDILTQAMKDSQYKTPRTDLALVMAAVRAQVQGAGRMTNVEVQLEQNRGSLWDRFRRQRDMALHGTLPDDQREDLLRTIKDAWLARAQTARAQWSTENPGQALPPYMKGEDINPEGAGGGTPPPGAKVIPLDQFLKGNPGG